MASGLSRRRVAAASDDDSGTTSNNVSGSSTPINTYATHTDGTMGGFVGGGGGSALVGGSKIAYDPRDLEERVEEGGKMPKLTIMEEVLLLGLKDRQVRFMFRARRILIRPLFETEAIRMAPLSPAPKLFLSAPRLSHLHLACLYDIQR
jgi:hypothetical protein